MKNWSYLIICCLLGLFACQSQKGLTIEGTVKGADGLEGFFEESLLSNTLSVAKTNFDGGGRYKIDLPNGLSAGIYRLRVGQKWMNLVLNGKEKNIRLDADLSTLQKAEYTVAGSPDTEAYLALVNGLESGSKKIINAKDLIDTAKNPLLSMLLALQIPQFQAPEYLSMQKSAAARVEDFLPASSYSKDYSMAIGQLESEAESAKIAAAAPSIAVGVQAPDISMKGPDGKTYSLADLKGKVVLLDFWASWCGPCRRESPRVVEAYKNYKSKGMEIFSVSLDSDPELWKSAITQDGLDWRYHVSDLKGWKNLAAQMYRVQSIPQQFLIGKDGKILAVITPGGDFETALRKAL